MRANMEIVNSMSKGFHLPEDMCNSPFAFQGECMVAKP